MEHFYDCNTVVPILLDFESYYADECMNDYLKMQNVILGYNCK